MNPLHEVFEYKDGGLYWKQSGQRRTVGKRCGTPFLTGYRHIMMKGKWYAEHRLIWEYFHGVPPTNFIDHIDGNKSNNVISNLREATSAENLANRGKQKNNTSGYKNICWDIGKNNYKVSISSNGKRIQRSTKDLEEARRWADELRNQLHGEFAKHE